MSDEPLLSVVGDKSISVELVGRGRVELVIDFHANGTRESIVIGQKEARTLGATLIVHSNLIELGKVMKAERLAREGGEPARLHRHELSESKEPLEVQCTGPAAVWCPICGDCECERSPSGERTEQSMICPLHGDGSVHGEPGAKVAQESVHCEAAQRRAEVKAQKTGVCPECGGVASGFAKDERGRWTWRCPEGCNP